MILLNATARLALDCSLSAWTGRPAACRWCDRDLPPRRTAWCTDTCHRAFEKNHIWRKARTAARRRAKYLCCRPGCSAARRDIEINHRTPLVGSGYGPGCKHHAEPDAAGAGGLEALCHAHHVEVSAQQRADRKAALAVKENA